MSKLPPVLANLPLPIIGSPLFIISNPKLVIAQCKAGVVGAMPALNARPAAQLEDWLAEITEELAAYNKANPDKPAAPFAINQIVHKSNDRLEHDMEMVVKYKVPIVITSLGARTDVNDAVHSYGGVTLHDIINNKFAQKAIEKGADGIIAVAAGAGGHAGVKSPFALVQEIRQWFDGPMALSGSIATGGAVLAAQAMGADFAYIGTAFIATARGARQRRIQAGDRRRQLGRHRLLEPVHRRARQLPGALASCAAGMDPDNLPEGDVKTMNFGGGEGSKAKAWKDIWGSGQGIGADHRSGRRRRLHREAQARVLRGPRAPGLRSERVAWRRSCRPAGGRMPLLDAVKGVACLLIVGHHLCRYGPLPEGRRRWRRHCSAGWRRTAGSRCRSSWCIAGFLAAASLAPDGVLRSRAGRWQRICAALCAAGHALPGGAVLHRAGGRGGAPLARRRGRARAAGHGAVAGTRPAAAGPAGLRRAVHRRLVRGHRLPALRAGARGDRAGRMAAAALALQRRTRALAGRALVLALAVASLALFNLQGRARQHGLYFFGAYGLGMLAFWIGRARHGAAPGAWPSRCWPRWAPRRWRSDWRSRIAMALVTALGVALAQRRDWLGAPPAWLAGAAAAVAGAHFVLAVPDPLPGASCWSTRRWRGWGRIRPGSTCSACRPRSRWSIAAAALLYRWVESRPAVLARRGWPCSPACWPAARWSAPDRAGRFAGSLLE